MATVSKGDQVTLFCDGISNNESSSDDDTDTEIKHQSKRHKVSGLEEKSKRSCLNCFMKAQQTVQYHLWAEMHDVGTHRYILLTFICMVT